MFKIQEIRELIKLVDQSNIDEFVYEFEDVKIKMKKNYDRIEAPVIERNTGDAAIGSTPPLADTVKAEPIPQVAVEAKETSQGEENIQSGEKEQYHQITSPMVGTFYQAPSPDAEPYVKVGSKVTKDTIVCIVEAMKLFNEIEAEVDGEIVEVLVSDGQLVEYGQPLFLVKPE